MTTLLSRCTVLLVALAPMAFGCAIDASGQPDQAKTATGGESVNGSVGSENLVVAPARTRLGNMIATGVTAPRAEIVGEDASCNPTSTPSPAGPAGAHDSWRAMDFTGQEWAFGARYQHTAVWDGREMLVFGGAVGDAPEAAAYEPNRDAWSKIAPSGLGQRVRHHAVWTGHAMIVWGGTANLEDGETTIDYDDGALYDPCSLTWRAIPKAPEQFREGASAVWASTTRELVVFGGTDRDGKTTNGGLAYRPATETWRYIAQAPFAPSANEHAVWTGAAMIAFSGETRDAAAYDATRDAWTALPSAPSATPRGDIAIASGASLASATFLFGPTGKTAIDDSGIGYFDMSGATWSTQEAAWVTIAAPAQDVLAERSNAMTWWGNDKLYVWGGHLAKNVDPYVHTAQDGASYDPKSGIWTHLPSASVYAMREGASVVWTGSEAIIIGGAASCTMCNPMPTGGEVFHP